MSSSCLSSFFSKGIQQIHPTALSKLFQGLITLTVQQKKKKKTNQLSLISSWSFLCFSSRVSVFPLPFATKSKSSNHFPADVLPSLTKTEHYGLLALPSLFMVSVFLIALFFFLTHFQFFKQTEDLFPISADSLKPQLLESRDEGGKAEFYFFLP